MIEKRIFLTVFLLAVAYAFYHGVFVAGHWSQQP